MKYLIALLYLLLSSTILSSQYLYLAEFKTLSTDLSARTNAVVSPSNQKTCAIIKVLTTQTGFEFDGGMIPIEKVVQKTAEIWLYIRPGSKKLVVAHPQLGRTAEPFEYPVPIEEATVYQVKLESGELSYVVKNEIASQWLDIIVEPSTAMIYINDGQYEATGEFQKKLKPGNYTYRVEAPMYHNTAGVVELKAIEKATVKVTLQPNFGYAKFSSSPEGANVVIDGIETSLSTPCTSDKLKSGEHNAIVTLPMYKTQRQNFTITDGITTNLNFELQPNFGTLDIKAPSDASIYINNQRKGTGPWNGRLDAGVYTIEAKKASYTTSRKDVELNIGETKSITLDPQPIYGSLDISSKPSGASISLKPYNSSINEVTPYTINNLLIGDYTVTLKKTGFDDMSLQVTVEQGKVTEINENLTTNGQATIEKVAPVGKKIIVKETNKIPVNSTSTTPHYSGTKFLMWTSIIATGALLYGSYNQYASANNDYDKYKDATTNADAKRLHQSVLDYQRNAAILAGSSLVTATCAILLKRKINRLKLTGYYNPSGNILMLTYNF